jgi:hypothetical protein
MPSTGTFLRKIKVDGYITEQFSYNQDNMISEVNSTFFYRKFHYDDNLKLIKEEVAISPDSYSSSKPVGLNHEFVDPDKTGIWLYQLYEYESNGNLARQLNYVSENGEYVLRSKRTFEYDGNNMISKVMLHNNEDVVTQFSTFQYDQNGNVSEENYYSCLFNPESSGPRHLMKATFEYDSYVNPYAIFKQSADPGIFTNRNNIIKTKSFNYEHTPGIDDYSESEFAYEYDDETRFPVKIKNGEEYIYD